MLIRALTAADSTSIISGETVFNWTSWLAASGPVPKRRMDKEGPSSASGGMMALTREPSGSRASTIGEDSSTLRPTRDTMRSMICSRWRSSRNAASALCSRPPFSMKTWSLSLTRMSEIFWSLSSGSSGPRPKTSSSRSVGEMARLAGINSRQLFQIQLGKQSPVHFGLEILQIHRCPALPLMKLDCNEIPTLWI